MQVRSCEGISANPTALLQEILPDRNVKTKEMSQKKIMGYEKGERQMRTRRLGKTGLMVSEIGFGGEWLERHPEEESIELIKYASKKGINILDCWMGLKRTAASGSFRDISDQPGRTTSISARET